MISTAMAFIVLAMVGLMSTNSDYTRFVATSIGQLEEAVLHAAPSAPPRSQKEHKPLNVVIFYPDDW